MFWGYFWDKSPLWGVKWVWFWDWVTLLKFWEILKSGAEPNSCTIKACCSIYYDNMLTYMMNCTSSGALMDRIRLIFQFALLKCFNTVLLKHFYALKGGHGLHSKTNIRSPKRAYLLFPHENLKFSITDANFYFGNDFGQTLINQAKSHFSHHPKLPKITPKIPSNP